MALFHRPLPRTLEACLRDLAEKSPLVRRSAIEDLRRFVHPQQADSITKALLASLSDTDALVRMHAAYALGDAQVSGALASLLVAIDDSHSLVRQAAIDAVGMLKDPRATGRLLRATRDERPDTRFQAIIAIGRVSPTDAVEVILRAMTDSDAKVRYIAVRVAEEISSLAPGRMQVPNAIASKLPRWLEDEDSRVRLAVAILLARTGDLSGRQQLVDAIEGRMVVLEADDEVAAIELAGQHRLEEAIKPLERRAFGFSRWFVERLSWSSRVALARMGHAKAIASIVRDLDSWSQAKRNAAVLAAAEAQLVDVVSKLETMRGNDAVADADTVEAAIEKLRLTDDSV